MNPKTLSVLILIIQNTCLVLTMRYSRTRSGELFLPSVAVCCDEFLKILTCFFALFLLNYRTFSFSFLVSEVCTDFSKICIPSLCYTIQKNLLYIAVSNLPAAVFQISYQFKIITTAFFSFVILRKSLNKFQISSLFLLVFGVCAVQTSSLSSSNENLLRGESLFFGFIAVCAACLTSGFSSVYFEYMLKSGNSQSHTIWTRNLQLSLCSIFFGILTVVSKDFDFVSKNGVFFGFDSLVLVVVSLEAFGGIVVAMVIKFADNIIKNFATAISIITSTIVSCLFFEFTINFQFIFGASFVFVSIFMYSFEIDSSLKLNLNDQVEMEQKVHSP